MKRKVVLAPGMAYEITVWRGESDERAVYIMEGPEYDDEVTYLSEAEARHLRDLLCEWFGAPLKRELGDSLQTPRSK